MVEKNASGEVMNSPRNRDIEAELKLLIRVMYFSPVCALLLGLGCFAVVSRVTETGITIRALNSILIVICIFLIGCSATCVYILWRTLLAHTTCFEGRPFFAVSKFRCIGYFILPFANIVWFCTLLLAIGEFVAFPSNQKKYSREDINDIHSARSRAILGIFLMIALQGAFAVIFSHLSTWVIYIGLLVSGFLSFKMKRSLLPLYQAYLFVASFAFFIVFLIPSTYLPTEIALFNSMTVILFLCVGCVSTIVKTVTSDQFYQTYFR